MSQPPKTRPKVPEGQARYYRTKQMEPNDKGFVGYQTIWDDLQKEVQYQPPKRP